MHHRYTEMIAEFALRERNVKDRPRDQAGPQQSVMNSDHKDGDALARIEPGKRERMLVAAQPYLSHDRHHAQGDFRIGDEEPTQDVPTQLAVYKSTGGGDYAGGSATTTCSMPIKSIGKKTSTIARRPSGSVYELKATPRWI